MRHIVRAIRRRDSREWRQFCAARQEPLDRHRASREVSRPFLAQADNLRGLAADERINVPPPRFERGAFFIRETVFLINADNAGETAAGMIQYFFDDGQVDAEPRQAACERSS